MRALSITLKAIEDRAGMYVGGSSEDRAEQLLDLQWFLIGYETALRDHGIQVSDCGGPRQNA